MSWREELQIRRSTGLQRNHVEWANAWKTILLGTEGREWPAPAETRNRKFVTPVCCLSAESKKFNITLVHYNTIAYTNTLPIAILYLNTLPNEH